MHELCLARDPVMTAAGEPVPGSTVRARLDQVKKYLSSPGKALVACFTGRDLPGMLTYLAALELGHAVLLKEYPAESVRDGLLDMYQPEFLIESGADPVPAGYEERWSFVDTRISVRSTRTSPDIHPELAVLMSTSGSLGRPKTIRLSYKNIWVNAQSLADTVHFGPADVGITSLPAEFIYGLSIANSHFVAGARLVLSRLSITSRGFWQQFGTSGVTNFGTVPASYRMLHEMNWRAEAYPALRLAHQSGGGQEVSVTKHFGRMMEANGGGFLNAYGATETCGRMAYLEPALLFDHLGSVGQPMPGGQIRLDETPGDGLGEIVYSGPTVMMGYATSRADLGKGDDIGGTLYTGDLGYFDKGMLYIAGRKDRQMKLYGRRITPEDIELQLAAIGPAAVIPLSDERAIVFVEGESAVFKQSLLDILRTLELPLAALRLQSVDSLPRTSTGKINFGALKSLAEGNS